VQVVRRSFAQLHEQASLNTTPSRELLLYSSSSSSSSSSANARTEISVVYFRAGYTPTDYPTQTEWNTRTLLERSRAIKCPSVALQLSGAKKVQQVLTEPGILERFIADDEYRLEKEELVTTFMKLYPMDDSPLGKEALKLAYSQPERFVLKPQREGGGNNIYKEDIPKFLDTLEKEDEEKLKSSNAHGNKKLVKSMKEPKSREGYILMELIEPPKNCKNAMVRANEELPRIGEVVSELGIYGVCLYEDTSTPVPSAVVAGNGNGRRSARAAIQDVKDQDAAENNDDAGSITPTLPSLPDPMTTPKQGSTQSGKFETSSSSTTLQGSITSNKQNHFAKILRNKNAGHLLRTKGRESDEGGVSVACICS
jgi:hypothetical protein